MNILHFANKLKGIRIETLMDESIMDQKEDIIDSNIDSLQRGFYPDGDRMPDYASASYAEFKKSIGSQAPMGVTDLKLSGDWAEGKYMDQIADGVFHIRSRDSKDDELMAKYGEDIHDLPRNYDKRAIKETFLNKLSDALL